MTKYQLLRPGEAHEPRIGSDAAPKAGCKELVLAWAKDSVTGEARHIGELIRAQTGQKCGCRCYSCDLPLEAVNAGKTEYKQRPHFRHPDGAPKADCAVLSARAVALELLLREGLIYLPRRRKSEKVAGLSGAYHNAWVEHPREKVSIADHHFEDRVTAIVTLEDGREFRISMVGSVETSDEDARTGIPTIQLIVNDPAIADMSPEDLRKRVTRIVDDGSWCSHWNDELLAQQALEAAKQAAINNCDWDETLLHIKAKEILETEKQIRLPDLFVEAEVVRTNGANLQRSSKQDGQLVALDSVTLEKPLGQIKPDVFATSIGAGLWPAETLLVEITVTNTITNERLERIRARNLPTLEIDISRMGGSVTLDEFRRLVVEEVAGKRWLHHPWLDQEKRRLDTELQAERAVIDAPIEQLRDAYLDAIEDYGWHRARADDGVEADRTSMAKALNKVYVKAKTLAARGYPEAEDSFLFADRGCILDRLLSIKQDRAIGYRVDTAWQVLNSILQERARVRWQTLYLTAIKVYQPTLVGAQEARVAEWRKKVSDSLNLGKDEYRRSTKYDRFISFLFPEMAKLLKVPLPGESERQESIPRSRPAPRGDARFQWTEVRSGMVNLPPRVWQLANFGYGWRARGFSVDSALAECAIRHEATWSEIVSAWSQAHLITGNVSYEDWALSADPADARWVSDGKA